MQRRIASFLFQRTSEEPYIFPPEEGSCGKGGRPASGKKAERRAVGFAAEQKPPRIRAQRLRLSKNPGVDKGPQPLMSHPALTTCASERMKPQRVSYFAGFAARERMREAKPVKARKSGTQPLFRHSEPPRIRAQRLSLWINSIGASGIAIPEGLIRLRRIVCRGRKALAEQGLLCKRR